MITIGKVDSLASKRRAFLYITKEDVVKKLFNEIEGDIKKGIKGILQ